MVCMEQVIVVITMILTFFTSIPACSHNLHNDTQELILFSLVLSYRFCFCSFTVHF